jgi:hypothetical protein
MRAGSYKPKNIIFVLVSIGGIGYVFRNEYTAAALPVNVQADL